MLLRVFTVASKTAGRCFQEHEWFLSRLCSSDLRSHSPYQKTCSTEPLHVCLNQKDMFYPFLMLNFKRRLCSNQGFDLFCLIVKLKHTQQTLRCSMTRLIVKSRRSLWFRNSSRMKVVTMLPGRQLDVLPGAF